LPGLGDRRRAGRAPLHPRGGDAELLTRRRRIQSPVPEIRVGISGWNYPAWRGNFYPDGLPQRLELAYASRRFNALEVNGTFYSLQRPPTFQSWYDATPACFIFA